MSMSRKKRPKVGDVVTLKWLDSGMDHQQSPRTAVTALNVSEMHGRVIHMGDCSALKARLPKGWSAERIVVSHCSAGEDDEGSHLGSVWWPSVVDWRVVE